MDKMKPPFQVAIVDDDSLHCWFWKRTLENRYGDKVRIKTFQNASEAIPHLNGNIGLVLLDWHMPHLDVKAFLEKVRERGIGPDRFVLFSGSDRSLTEEEFGKAGILAVIEKGRTEQEDGLLRLLDGLILK